MQTIDSVVPPESDDQKDIRMNKDVAAFSYVWIMSVVIFASRKDSKFIQYHSRQAVILFLASIVAALVPFIGKYLVMLIVAGMLLGFINAAQGHYADVPFAGDLAKGKLSVGDLMKMAAQALHRLVAMIKSSFRGAVKKQQETPSAPVAPTVQQPEVKLDK